MENNQNASNKIRIGRWVVGVISMFTTVVCLVMILYFMGSEIRFQLETGPTSVSQYVYAIIMALFGFFGLLSSLRFSWQILPVRKKGDEDRLQLFYGGMATIVYFVFLLLNFIFWFGSASFIQLQLRIFLYECILIFPELLVSLLCLVAVAIMMGNAEKTEKKKKEKAGAAVFWNKIKGQVLRSALITASIFYIFTGQHSITGERTDAFLQFTAQELSGEPADQSIFADHQLTLVNVWGTFCGPCLNEMPDLAQLQTEYEDRGFQIVGVCADIVDRNTGSINQTLYDMALELVAETGADTYHHLIPAGDLMEHFIAKSVVAFPTTVFVNEKGEQVGDMVIGFREKEEWINEIEKRYEILEEESANES